MRRACHAKLMLSTLWLQDLEPGSFDTITCFSVTKWVHLNGGDEALQALLAKVYSLLAPGGRFILEPQQWVSYKKAVRKPVSAPLLYGCGSLSLPGERISVRDSTPSTATVQRCHMSEQGPQKLDRSLSQSHKPCEW